jgi:hypothetical protein
MAAGGWGGNKQHYYKINTCFLLHTVLSVASRNVPGIEIPVPPPMVMPFKIATYKEIVTHQCNHADNLLIQVNL